ncbi:alpha/beta hydrolase [Thermoleophilum album]|jgi:haloalkane dehalogenase|uniref:alpha/beta fold hydrolase n=1 Tax=Thermoleophilum album TaxID=29539 RepID=UPI00237C7B0C|nr:alpha/beta hydrolase [Thermoleophilum album]WDT93617.1 alpha/beta hydrolase [Thermoleophilum album]
MSSFPVHRDDAPLAYRCHGPRDGLPVLMLHGYPESSYMWRHLLGPVGEAGFRAIAPDLANFGDSPLVRPGNWERQIERVELLRRAIAVDRFVLVVHDWGGLIGLRWVLERELELAGLVVSCTGFFSDGRWHGLAETMRTPDRGEELMEALTRDLFAQALRSEWQGFDDATIDEYWKGLADREHRMAQLELYRSGDFEKIAPLEGRLRELDVPTLVLWGGRDRYAPVGGAHRFAKLLPQAELVVFDDAGHFVFEEAPERCTEAVLALLARVDR